MQPSHHHPTQLRPVSPSSASAPSPVDPAVVTAAPWSASSAVGVPLAGRKATETIEKSPTTGSGSTPSYWKTHNCKRYIFEKEEMAHWQSIHCPARMQIVQFLHVLSDSIQGLDNDAIKALYQNDTNPIHAYLLNLYTRVFPVEYAEMFPPPEKPSGSRYGHIIFRQYLAHIIENSETLIRQLLSLKPSAATQPAPEWHLRELQSYLCESNGNMIRIDYGSGHELAFVAFMYCLHKLELVSDLRWLAGVLYPAYIGNYIRPIVLKRYRCEPAGSHGSWGLDDYYFVSYILGSSQLVQQQPTGATAAKVVPSDDNPFPYPKSALSAEKVTSYHDKYMYIENIYFVMQSKQPKEQDKLLLQHHSPMLYSIQSTVPNWAKVHSGMMKMYLAEVLDKFVIVQHFVMGRCLGWSDAKEDVEGEVAESSLSSSSEQH